MYADPSFPAPPVKPKKRWGGLVVAGIIWLVASVTAVFVVLTLDHGGGGGGSDKETGGFRTTYAAKAPTYAGNAVYDACDLLSLSTVAQHVPNYRESLELVGTGKRPTSPLIVAHRYVDRDIPTPLGKDGEARPVSTVISLGGTVPQSLDNFSSKLDSNCAYGQGQVGVQDFAKVSVTQKPTPLAPELVKFLSTMESQGLKKRVSGLDVYTEKQPDTTNFYGSLVLDSGRGVAVFVETNKAAFTADAVTEIIAKLKAAPKGPVQLSYPAPYTKAPNPCGLLGAADFENLTRQPASALAEETLNLNETGDVAGQAVRRSCDRFEVDRFTNEVAKSSVSVDQWRDEASINAYLQRLRDGGVQLKGTKEKIGDESFVKVGKNTRGQETYSFLFRSGARLIALNVTLDVPSDTSADVYESRMTPAAKIVAQNLPT